MNTNETQMQSDAFTVHFGDELNDQEKVKFFLKMENADYIFNDSVTLAVKAPNLKYGKLSITDLEGNEMNRLMKGQSSYLTFDIENQGESKSMEISNKFNLMAPFLNVDQTEVSIPAIEAGDSGQVTFLAHVDDDAVDGIINYSLQAESGYHTDQIERPIPLGYTTEDFENETLNKDLQWNLGSGNKKWYITEDTTAIGGHCMHSPSIGNNAIANLHIGIHTEIDDTFSFYHKTSTEEGDMLMLILNGQEMGVWSGISDWEQEEFQLPAGNYLIRFSFKKDNEGSLGEDAVMIDHLHFPPFAKMVLYAGDDTEACPNATFTPEGYIYNQSEITWSTNGDGTFDDITAEHPTYIFGEADKSQGRVELTLTGTSMLNEDQQSSIVTVNLLPVFDPNYTPQTPIGDVNVDLRLVSQSEFVGEEISDVIYTWNIEPPTAGTIISDGHQAHVEWDGNYRGQVSIGYHYENPCGSTAVSEALVVNVFNSTGIDDQEIPIVEVYPNPAHDMIYVKTLLEGDATLRVIDLMGKVVFECKMTNNECRIETSKFGGGGIYTLQVIQKDIIKNVRIVVMP